VEPDKPVEPMWLLPTPLVEPDKPVEPMWLPVKPLEPDKPDEPTWLEPARPLEPDKPVEPTWLEPARPLDPDKPDDATPDDAPIPVWLPALPCQLLPTLGAVEKALVPVAPPVCGAAPETEVPEYEVDVVG
jgi:hypothetical protein